MSLKQTQLGKTFIGSISFDAATEGELALDKGGHWNPDGGYSAGISVLPITVDTFSVDTATNSHSYSIVYDGTTYTYVADSSTSQAEVRDGLIAAVNDANPADIVAASVDGTHFKISGLTPGVFHTVGDVDALLSVSKGLGSIPAHGVFKDHEKITVRFASAFTGKVDVFVGGN